MQRKKKSDNLIFVLFVVAVLVVGSLMLFWGQRNSAVQVFDMAFMHYDADKQLASDEDYLFTDDDAADYAGMLSRAEAWRTENPGESGSVQTVTAAALFGEDALCTLPYIFYDRGGACTAILLHGYNETPEDAAIFAPYWWDKGCNVLIPQLRGYSEESPFSTFGVYEQYDLLDLIGALEARLPGSRLVLHGHGSGAAAALLLAGDERAPAIDLIVADSVYAELDTLKQEQLKKQFNLGEFFVGKILSSIVQKHLGFDTKEISVLAAVGRETVPTLFVCGGADGFVGPENTEAVFTAASGEASLLVVEGARNRMAYTRSELTDGAYRAAMDALFARTSAGEK